MSNRHTLAGFQGDTWKECLAFFVIILTTLLPRNRPCGNICSMNLTTISLIVRRTVVGFTIFLGGYLFATIAIPQIIEFVRSTFPQKIIINTSFGQPEQLEFIQQPIKTTNPEIVLNTKNGRLPSGFPNAMKVYAYKNPRFSYSAGKDAQKHALILGFTDSDLITDLKETVYKWRNQEYGGELQIELNTRKVILNTPLEKLGSIYGRGAVTEFGSIDIAKQLLTQFGRFDTLYEKGTPRVQFGKVQGQRAVGAGAPSEAQFAKVDFFRNLGDIPILGPNAKQGLLQVVVTYNDRTRLGYSRVPAPLAYPYIEAYFWEVNTKSYATYPIISVKTAWQAVREGKAVITSVVPKDQSAFEPYIPQEVEKILINDIYLAYYDSKNLQKHLQPIYVFDGNYTSANGSKGDVTLYVPAVQKNYIQE